MLLVVYIRYIYIYIEKVLIVLRNEYHARKHETVVKEQQVVYIYEFVCNH